MRKPPCAFVVAVAIPFLSGCMGINALPVPAPSERVGLDVRGVVVDEQSGERVRFSEVSHVQWGDSTVTITGFRDGSASEAEFVTDTWSLSDIDALLVHGVDSNRTSILVGGLIVGTIVAVAIAITGGTTDTTIFR